MKRNIGTADRIIRIVVGIVLIAIGITTKSWWGFLGIIPLLTAVAGWCPLYVPFGIKTCSARKAAF